MNLPHRWIHHYLGKTALIAAALAAFATFGAAPTLRADNDCQRRINRADHRLHEAIEHHGYRSPQADSARHNLAEAREYCWGHGHRWWDSDSQNWHTEHDWRDEDHEHYRDHDRNDHR
jgi:hypothetical protein